MQGGSIKTELISPLKSAPPTHLRLIKMVSTIHLIDLAKNLGVGSLNLVFSCTPLMQSNSTSSNFTFSHPYYYRLAQAALISHLGYWIYDVMHAEVGLLGHRTRLHPALRYDVSFPKRLHDRTLC